MLFCSAKARVYQVVDEDTSKNINKGKGKSKSKGKGNTGKVSYLQSSRSEAEDGAGAGAESRFSLKVVVEENPKWTLAQDVLDEIGSLYETQRTTLQVTRRSSKDGDDGDEEVTEEEEVEVAGGGRVLVLVRDEHTSTQLRQHAALGGRLMMKKRFLEFIEDTEERSGRIAAAKQGRRWKGARSTEYSKSYWRQKQNQGRGMTGVGIGAMPHLPSSATNSFPGVEGTSTSKEVAAAIERQLLKQAGAELKAELAHCSRIYYKKEGGVEEDGLSGSNVTYSNYQGTMSGENILEEGEEGRGRGRGGKRKVRGGCSSHRSSHGNGSGRYSTTLEQSEGTGFTSHQDVLVLDEAEGGGEGRRVKADDGLRTKRRKLDGG
ncbi:unnamed protein product, partial [Choristocarpus tenellus]